MSRFGCLGPIDQDLEKAAQDLAQDVEQIAERLRLCGMQGHDQGELLEVHIELVTLTARMNLISSGEVPSVSD